MRAGRNPRRAYDEYGNGIPPATVGNKVARGYKTVMAFNARGCGHNAPVPLAGLPPDFPISDIALRASVWSDISLTPGGSGGGSSHRAGKSSISISILAHHRPL